METQVRPATGVARLTLTINGVPYDVRPVKDPKYWAVRLVKEDKTSYIVRQTEMGPFCSCPDFAKRNRKGGCKHIKALAIWSL